MSFEFPKSKAVYAPETGSGSGSDPDREESAEMEISRNGESVDAAETIAKFWELIAAGDYAEALKAEGILSLQSDVIRTAENPFFDPGPNAIPITESFKYSLETLFGYGPLIANDAQAAGRIAEILGLSETDWKDLDVKASQNPFASEAFGRYIPYLAATSDPASIYRHFPQTLEKIRQGVFNALPNDALLAENFIDHLDRYWQEPWAKDGVEKAVYYHVTAAEHYFTKINQNPPWVDASWSEEMSNVANGTLNYALEDQDQNGAYARNDEGIRESDPFENDPRLFTDEQARYATQLAKAINGDLQVLNSLSPEQNEAYAAIHEQIQVEMKQFLSDIRQHPQIPVEDSGVLLGDSNTVRMSPLEDMVINLVARYLAQTSQERAHYGMAMPSPEGMGDRLREGFEAFMNAYIYDIPMYDKLYDEFDTLRETGRMPLEVYLGRDGIYAWIGRRAQDIARRRKLGLEGRRQLRERGEVLELNPKYMVYPRYFRDNLSYETQRAFLEQERISPEADPLFYDTGYKGTVPEQIMRVMDFDEEDVESRIRLLSAEKSNRRLRGIPQNARNDIVEHIEHNAKLENSAIGIVRDAKTDKLRPIAEPTSPEEQFKFMMIKQAIARHYWIKEHLHHEPSGNINLDSEHYRIRMREEYAQALPPEFLQDPQTFFAEHAERLKGGRGEGEYPDEHVVSFMLVDGIELVAKKIELRKAKDVHEEFSILIAAKKAGLPGAAPVGFLRGKEENDGSWLLMKRADGISGRHFEKWLRDSGKSEGEIQNILQNDLSVYNATVASDYRNQLGIDKEWRYKDLIIDFDEERGVVRSVTPIDWERAVTYDPNNPKSVQGEMK